jgi:hypothetical protein
MKLLKLYGSTDDNDKNARGFAGFGREDLWCVFIANMLCEAFGSHPIYSVY